MMNKKFSGSELRDWALQCEAQSHDPTISGTDRERLLKMKHALLDLAHTDEWLHGHTPVTIEIIEQADSSGG